MNVADRALKYILRISSIEGQNGDDAAFHAACVCAEGFGLSASEMRPLMQQWNQQCAQPKWEESRIEYKIKEAQEVARASSRRGYLIKENTNGTRYKPVMPHTNGKAAPAAAAVSTELPAEINSVSALLKAAFKPGECISICKAKWYADSNRAGPEHSGVVLPLEKWLEKAAANGDSLEKWFSSEYGAYVRCNPMKPDDSTDKGVTAFRHAVVEFDKLSELEQWNKIQGSGAPITAVIHSGGKSLHAWVRVDAKDNAEYDERVKVLLDAFTGADRKVSKNPNRFSRLPCITRQGRRQRLLALNIGAQDWASWPKPTISTTDSQAAIVMPDEDLSLSSLNGFKVEDDPNSILGNRYLCRGGSCLIVGPSGVGKSSLNLQAAMTWADGRPLFGLAPSHGLCLKSLIVQAENDKGDLAEEVQGVAAGLGLNATQVKELEQNIRIRRQMSMVGWDFVTWLRKEIKEFKPDLVWLDPLMSYLGADINSQKDCSQFFRTFLNPVGEESGVVWMIIHHTGKPPKPKPGHDTDWSNSDPDYAGIGSSELTNWARATMFLRPQRDQYLLVAKKRGARATFVDKNGKAIDARKGLAIKHSAKGILWEYADEIEPPKYKPKKTPPKEEKAPEPTTTVAPVIAGWKPGHSKITLEMFIAKWTEHDQDQNAVMVDMGISKATFYRFKKEMEDKEVASI